MIANDQELRTTLLRLAWFEEQVAYLSRAEPNDANRRASASGFLSEMTRMRDEIAAYATAEAQGADAWDEQIETDIRAGRLDAAGKRVDEEFEAGRCEPL
jgi:hypothetical protein